MKNIDNIIIPRLPRMGIDYGSLTPKIKKGLQQIEKQLEQSYHTNPPSPYGKGYAAIINITEQDAQWLVKAHVNAFQRGGKGNEKGKYITEFFYKSSLLILTTDHKYNLD